MEVRGPGLADVFVPLCLCSYLHLLFPKGKFVEHRRVVIAHPILALMLRGLLLLFLVSEW